MTKRGDGRRPNGFTSKDKRAVGASSVYRWHRCLMACWVLQQAINCDDGGSATELRSRRYWEIMTILLERARKKHDEYCRRAEFAERKASSATTGRMKTVWEKFALSYRQLADGIAEIDIGKKLNACIDPVWPGACSLRGGPAP
ncbi:MAG: hypothetical protein WDM89_22065 [Rhizomicrobium sp.]